MMTSKIDLSMFNKTNQKYESSVIVILNKPSNKDMLKEIGNKVQYRIFTNGCTNEIYDTYGWDLFMFNCSFEFIPDCVVGDIYSMRDDVKVALANKNTKLIVKSDEDRTDLEKTLYYCLEKLNENDSLDELESMKKCLIVYFNSDNRVDHIFSIYNDVYKCYLYYKQQMQNVDLFLISDSSTSVYLKNGINEIVSSSQWENRQFGYSIICLSGEANIILYERKSKKVEYLKIESKILQFGMSFIFRKNVEVKQIKIAVETANDCSLIFSTVQ